MSYEEFISDLPLEDTIVFNSVEENEETMQHLGVNQQIRQSGKGNFQAHMAARSFDQLELFADRFSTAFSMYLEPPEGMVGFLLPRSVNGQFTIAPVRIRPILKFFTFRLAVERTSLPRRYPVVRLLAFQ